MRKSTLAFVSFLIAFLIVYFGRWIKAGAAETSHFGSTFFISMVLTPLVTLMLTPLNRRLLAWRKSRGRDIEEEERYETKDGMIRLTPNDDEPPETNDEPDPQYLYIPRDR